MKPLLYLNCYLLLATCYLSVAPLEHIRYRTGLLLERRPNVFGFAHLTFQEYLAATAIHEGNKLDITPQQLVTEHDDSRWREVIALYAGVTTTPAVRELIESLINQEDTELLGQVLADVYFASSEDLKQDAEFRKRVIERIAIAPNGQWSKVLERFFQCETISIANDSLGKTDSDIVWSNAYTYLFDKPKLINFNQINEKIRHWRRYSTIQLAELIIILHRFASNEILLNMDLTQELYLSKAPIFNNIEKYKNQLEVAINAVAHRKRRDNKISEFILAKLLHILSVSLDNDFFENNNLIREFNYFIVYLLQDSWYPKDVNNRKDIAKSLNSIIEQYNLSIQEQIDDVEAEQAKEIIDVIRKFINHLERKQAT